MKVLTRATYIGPNYFAPRPLAVVAVDFGDLVLRPAADLPAETVDRLRAAVPEAAATIGAACGDGSTAVPQLLPWIARDLQRAEAEEVEFAEAGDGPRSIRHLFVEFMVAEIGHASLDLALRLLVHALRIDTVDLAAARLAFARTVERFQLGRDTRLLLRAAARRGIPWHRLSPSAPVVQLGQGRHRQRIHGTITGRLSLASQWIAGDRASAHGLMRRAGVAVPEQMGVATAAAAARAARRLGYPVVMKATRVGKGKGVIVDLGDEAAVADAFARLAHLGPIVVERQIPGDDHRLLVIGGRTVAVVRRLSARQPADQGPDPETVVGSGPGSGRTIVLRPTADVSTGATTEDVTAITHGDYAAAAEAAARAVDLDLAGVDLVSTDITRPLAETGGGVSEIDADPGFGPHVVDPASPDVVGAMLDWLFPRGDGRIPIAAITGTNGKTTTARMVGRIMQAAGMATGIATTATVEVAGRILTTRDSAGTYGARRVLEDPTVDVAVLETARGGIWHYGLAFDRCTVGAVLNVGDDHVGAEGVRDRAMLARIKRLVVETATGLAVLNATDPACVAMRPHSPAPAACWIASDPGHPLVGDGRPTRDMAVTVSGAGTEPRVVLRVGGTVIPIVRLADLPAIDGGRARHNLENALFATAIAWGLGAHPRAIAEGLSAYDLSFASARGRTSRYEGLPFQVLIDFAHNKEAMTAICRYASALAVAGRRICVIHGPGNRPPAHYAAIARAAVPVFDRYFVCDPDDRRGREPGEIAALVAAGLVAAGVDAACVAVVLDEPDAVRAALATARPGDLLAVMAYFPERTLEIVRAFHAAAG